MRIQAHHLDEFVDVPSCIQGQQSVFAVALDVHSEVVFYRRPWGGFISFVESEFEFVDYGVCIFRV